MAEQKELIIEIKRQDIYDEVSKISHYAGAKATDDAGAYERMALTDAENEMIDRYIDDATPVLESLAGKYLNSTQESSGVITIRLMLPSTWRSSNGSMIKSLAKRYYAETSICGWMSLTKKDLVEEHQTASSSALTMIRDLIYDRERHNLRAILEAEYEEDDDDDDNQNDNTEEQS